MNSTLPSLSLSLLVLMACNARIEALSSAPAPAGETIGASPPSPESSGDAGVASTVDGSVKPPTQLPPYSPPLDHGPSTKCDWMGEVFTPLPAACKNRCLAEYSKGKAARVIADDGDLPYKFNQVAIATPTHAIVVAYNYPLSSGAVGGALVAFPVAGGAPTVLTEFGSYGSASVTEAGSDLLITVSSQLSTTSYETTVYRMPQNALAPLGTRVPLATVTTPSFYLRVWQDPVGDILIEHDAGTPAGGVTRILANGTVQSVLAEPGLVRAASSGGYLYWVQNMSPSSAQYGSKVFRRLMPSAPAEFLLDVVDAAALDIADPSGPLVVMGAQNLYALDPNGANARVLFKGTSFVQHAGTLDPRYVRYDAKARAVQFGEICHFDADAPGYGARALWLDQSSVSWLDENVSFPWLTENFRFGPPQRWSAPLASTQLGAKAYALAIK